MPTPPPGEREVLRLGPPPRRGRTVGIVAVCLAVILGGVGWWWHGRPAPPVPTRSPSPSPVVPTPASTPSVGPPPRASSADLSWLGATSGWQIFIRTETSGSLPGPGAVVRVEPRTGQMSQTHVPGLASGGPVSFLVDAGATYIHPVDFVPGYVVPDGHGARRSAPRIPDGGIFAPGPKPGQVWAELDTQPNAIVLLALGTGPTSVSIPVPSAAGFPYSDGAGHVMVPRQDGTYDVAPGSVRRVTTGDVVAVGPKTWAVTTCTKPPCRLTTVDAATGARHAVPGRLPGTFAPGGVTTPDGRRAAVLLNAGDAPSVVLVDLTTGTTLPTGVSPQRREPGAIQGQGTLAWSPDGRWLFVVADGGVDAIDARTGRVRPLGLDLPPDEGEAQQVVVRP